MAKIRIDDLADSVELDQQAMQAIYGGARSAAIARRGLLQQKAGVKTSLFGQAMASNPRWGKTAIGGVGFGLVDKPENKRF